jgi:hypothetical protein
MNQNKQASDRLVQLAQLADGWRDGDGRAADRTSLRLASQTIKELMQSHGLSRPMIGLTEDGTICADWNTPGKTVGLEFRVDGIVEAQAVWMKPFRFLDCNFNCADAKAIAKFIKNPV